MHPTPRLRSVADDHQRRDLIRWAIAKGREQARGDFLYGLAMDGLDDESIALFAEEAWRLYGRQVEFDYPRFAHSLCLRGYRAAYRTCVRDLADGKHHSTEELVTAVEAEAGLGQA
jgi:hypothetical protein